MQRTVSGTRPLLGATVLIVDDELLIGLDLEALLQQAGGAVVGPCLTLEDGMRAAKEAHVDAAILDIRLGTETTEPIADILFGRGIPFFFYSGHRFEEGTRGKSFPVRIIAKPAAQSTLVDAVASLLGVVPAV